MPFRFPPWKKDKESLAESLKPQRPSEGPPVPKSLEERIKESATRTAAALWEAHRRSLEEWEKLTPEEKERILKKREEQKQFAVRMSHYIPPRPGVLPFPPFYPAPGTGRTEYKTEYVYAKDEREARQKVYVPLGWHIDSVHGF